MSYLLDTNVISEMRKRDRCNPGVVAWFDGVEVEDLFVSVLTIGELRKGVDSLARRDQDAAAKLNHWLCQVVIAFEDRILDVDSRVAEEWGRMNVSATLPTVDGLLAATAKRHRLTLVTRNTQDIARTGVSCLNPFEKNV
ncbi:MAG TPA: type II toxin-antitoxin system VapC family toxin [Vicinamibacterales bacterium]|nr:type II toxin-antitoxin system VapC family toxin [Vicinamibacterales bacterium]